MKAEHLWRLFELGRINDVQRKLRNARVDSIRHGLVKRRRRRRHHPEDTSLSRPHLPKDLWCADYKGEFMLADRRYCYPLTISDFASRYLISCEALANTRAMFAFTVFERAFKDFGLPRAIRTDNGSPFASANSLFGLTKPSVWWLRLGIDIERIKPGIRNKTAAMSACT